MSHTYEEGELVSYTGNVFPTDTVYVFVKYQYQVDMGGSVAVIKIMNDSSEFNVFTTNIKPFYARDINNHGARHLLDKED